MFVCCECCVLSGRGFCEGLINRPEESYLLWNVIVCDLETSRVRRLKTRKWVVKASRKRRGGSSSSSSSSSSSKLLPADSLVAR
jgi:hypothetical protein